MQHKLFVGIPKGKGFENVQEIPSNEAFNYMRRGFKTLDEEHVEIHRKAVTKAAAAKASSSADNGDKKKTGTKAGKKVTKKAAKKTTKKADENDEQRAAREDKNSKARERRALKKAPSGAGK